MSQDDLVNEIAGDDHEDEPRVAEQDIAEEPAEAAESDAEEPKQEEKEVEKPQGVPPGIMAEQRRKNRELQEQNQRLEQRLNAIQQQQDQLLKAKQEAEKPKAPDFNEDPAGFLHYQNQELANELKAIKQQSEQQTETNQRLQAQQQQESNLLGHIQTFEQGFVKDNADYYDAISHIRNASIQNMVNSGYTQQQAIQAVTKQEFMSAVQLMAAGENPAEIFYNRAKKMGYKGKAQESDEEKLATMEKGQKAGKRLGSSSKPSLKDVADMDDDAFGEFLEAQKELFG